MLSELLSKKQINDEEDPKKIKNSNLLFASTGTIGEIFPEKKISSSLQALVDSIRYVQNKYIWIKAGMGILTTDTRPKLSMEECKIAGTTVKNLWTCKRIWNDTSRYGNYTWIYIYRCQN